MVMVTISERPEYYHKKTIVKRHRRQKLRDMRRSVLVLFGLSILIRLECAEYHNTTMLHNVHNVV
ncbi:hypothetical protein SERLA73DRAFT_147639, partial [Serpula lacrymans var. lacrymans S7.3]